MVKILLYLLIIYLFFQLIKFVGKLLLPYLLRKFVEKNHPGFNPKQTEEDTFKSRKNPDITIKRQPKNKNKKDLGGDYVDFEEMKE